MDSTPVITSLNLAVTLSIGMIALFIVYSSYRKMEDELLKEFSRRLLLVIVILLLFTLYWGVYTFMLFEYPAAIYPFYMALIFIFIYLIWTVSSFERLTKKYGMSDNSKLEKMERQEELR